MRHALVVVMVVAGCGDRPASRPDASGGGPDTADASVDGPGAIDASVDGPPLDAAVDGPPDAAGPPVTCTQTAVAIPNSRGSSANAIDGAGNIAGEYGLATGETRAFRWHASTGFVDLGTLGGDFATALGISGELTVGNSTVAPGDTRPFITDASGMHELTVPTGAHNGHAFGVNASGIAVGDARFPDGSVHALKYQNGMAIDLGTLRGRLNSTALAISDSGVIVGKAYDDVPGNEIAVMWVNGEITSLGPGMATAVDPMGDIAVGGRTMYRDGTVIPLGLPRPLRSCPSSPLVEGAVRGVNDAGWIVGFASCRTIESSGLRNPTIYIDGVAWNMNDVMPRGSLVPAQWSASAINNAGQIAATAESEAPRSDSALLITCTRP